MALSEQARAAPPLAPAQPRLTAAAHIEVSRGTRVRRWIQRMDTAAVVGVTLVSVFILTALLAPLLMPHDPLAQDVARRLKPPGFVDPRSGLLYPLGTDGLGRDILSRLIAGARVSLLVGLLGASVSATLGTTLGLTTGYFGGWWDSTMMRLVDIWQAIPFTILAIAVVVILGPSTQNVILVLGFTSWVNYARVVRAETLSQRHGELVVAARVIGARDTRILALHVLPQVTASVIVLTSLLVASMILFEASLSFLGLGVQPPTPSWGNMVLDGVEPIRAAWWVAFFPGVAILLAVMGINLLGDWLRDVLDPRQRTR
jgi:peptide/nickel transport system permease protein